MRFKVIGKVKENIIPLNYRTMMMSTIKKSIELGDEELFKELYYYGDKKNKKIKPFSFALYFNNYKVVGQAVKLYGDVSLTISTPDYNLGIAIYNGMLKLKEHTYKNTTFIKSRVVLEKEDKIVDQENSFKTLSPIYIKNTVNKPLSPYDAEFNKEFNYISNIMLESYRGEGLREELVFTPINMKKMVIKEEIKDFVEECKKDYMYITAYSGVFRLSGNSEDVQLLMQLAVGFRRSEGFGLIALL